MITLIVIYYKLHDYDKLCLIKNYEYTSILFYLFFNTHICFVLFVKNIKYTQPNCVVGKNRKSLNKRV